MRRRNLLRAMVAISVAIVSSQVALALPTVIETQVSPINGHAYHLLEPSTWTEAEAKAVLLGGHLATIRSSSENEWIVNTFSGKLPGGGYSRLLWIGLNDVANEGNFVWSSGEPVVYSNWEPGEPNNSGGNEDWVQMGYGISPGPWNDLHDTSIWGGTPLHGVAEINAIPEPSGVVLVCIGSALVLIFNAPPRR